MKEEDYEVVIVGAGPAGSSTAKIAAKNGLDVLLIERNKEIGVPVRCAEGIPKEIEKFVKVDKKWICAEIKGINMYGPDGTKVAISVENDGICGYMLERRIFDRCLVKEAAKAGANVQVNTQVYNVIKEEKCVKGVCVKYAGEEKRIFADVVVGADGVESKVGKWAGLDTTLQLSDVGICAEFLMCGIEVKKDQWEIFFGNDIAPKGYAWIFPKGEDCANIGLGMGGDISSEKHRAVDYLRRFVEKMFPEGSKIAEIYGAVPLSGPIYKIVADGIILVGDAARQTNPLSGGGILEAMKAGKMAGGVIAKAIEEKNTSKKKLKEYENRWRRDYGKDLNAALKAKNFFLAKSSEELSNFFHSLSLKGELKLKEFNERELMKEIVKRNPKMLFSLARMLFS